MSKKATKLSIDDNLKQLVLMRTRSCACKLKYLLLYKLFWDLFIYFFFFFTFQKNGSMGNETLNWDGLSLKQFVNEHFCCL